ncbi:helix-turn-helix domain-containing protein [Autumnicola edwardsiae]|uniref:AraC family transcriptional regulator n=1 Tax=Autumnicola edwardsiae TaxID=3075594 RepID=A0ABU3CWS2_9FLAO|nr:AraC family transcriptional regulator [Zunongwangia sp. F297]MDT0650667.1 AraC family transcriptional regulator [Zunongwangia sp. F297]
MREVDLVTIAGIISTFIALLLAIFIFSVESNNKISNKLFASFLVLNALEFSSWFMHLLFDTPNNLTNNLLIAKDLLAYLPMPVFYLYVLSVCYSDFKLKWKHLWHALPYLVANLVMIPRVYLSNTAQKLELLVEYNSLYEIIFLHISLHLQAIIYLTAGFIVLGNARKIFLENYSSNTIATYKWLFQLLFFTSLLYAVALIKNILKYYGEDDVFNTAQTIVVLFVLGIVCWYVLKALRYPNLFSGVDSKIALAHNLADNDESGINKIYDNEIQQLIYYMETEKPYFNPSLSIRNLADQMEMNSRELSILINQKLNQHFFDFINEYRIKEAMKILANPAKEQETVLEILYEVGFNSKSSFNTAFKKHTGKTPTEFRRIRLKSVS